MRSRALLRSGRLRRAGAAQSASRSRTWCSSAVARVAAFLEDRLDVAVSRRRSSPLRSLAVSTTIGIERHSGVLAQLGRRTRSRPSPASSGRAGSGRGARAPCTRSATRPFSASRDRPAVLLQHRAHHVARRRIVVDHQHRAWRGRGRCTSAGSATGASRSTGLVSVVGGAQREAAVRGRRRWSA